MAKKNEFVIDSSVVAKWFLIEPDSDLSKEIRDDFATGKIGLAVPTLMFYEVMNAIRFSGLFDETDLAIAARSLSLYRFGIWRPVGKLLELSVRLSLRENLSVFDACYVALAQKRRSSLITEDQDLLKKFPSHTIPMHRYSPDVVHPS